MQETELLGNENLGSKLIKKSFWLYFFMIFTAPIGYIIKVIVSNQMSVADIGLFYSILGFIGLVSVYNDLGLTEALQYFSPKYWIEKKYDNYKTIIYLTFFVQIISGILIGGLMYLGADWLAVHQFSSPGAGNIIKTFSVYFFMINFLQAFGNFFTSFQDTFSAGITDSVRMFSILGFTICFWFNNTLNSETFSLAWLAGLGISMIIAIFIFIKKYRYTLKLGKFHPTKSVVKEQLKYAFWVFIAANVGSLFAQLNQQFVINFYGAEYAGYYTNYLSLTLMFSLIIGPVLSLLFPITTELITKNEHEKFSILQNILYKYFSIFALSVSGLFLIFGQEIATILFGSKFIYSGTLLIYSAPFLLFSTLFSINYGIMAGLGKVQERVKILFWSLLGMILVNICAIVLHNLGINVGLLLIIVSNVVGRIIMRILSFRIINKYEKIYFDWKYFIGNFLTLTVICILLYSLKDRFFVLNDVRRYYNILYLTITLLIYYGILALVNYKEIKKLIGEIKILRPAK